MKLLMGNEALALGALHAGVRVVTGYPGTPSTDALASLIKWKPEGVHVEWSVNEKVALDIAAGAAWAGQRAMCTMKMSGLNVAYDSLISVAHSGIVGALVVYVADDPGANAGMVEQDSRGFAIMSDLPMLEPASVGDIYRLTRQAFELSEVCGSPVFVRLVTMTSNAYAAVEIDDNPPVPEARKPVLLHDINKFTKAGSKISLTQHLDVIARLDTAGKWIGATEINSMHLSKAPGGVGVIAAGSVAAFLPEGIQAAASYGLDPEDLSTLRIQSVHPYPAQAVETLMGHCRDLLVLEELEPWIENQVILAARRTGFTGQILGKNTGLFNRVGEYGVAQVVRGLSEACHLAVPVGSFDGNMAGEQLAAARPITVCAGCPHRGTYMAINRAVRRAGYKKDQIMVTGDIGCTILGMNPPFDTIWNEVSMGASIGLAQGYVHAGVPTPVIATIGDSTFFHAGIPALVNAIQYQTPLTLIIMDNGWTSMTGMQVNPGTDCEFQQTGAARLDIARIVPALGVEEFVIVDPFDLGVTSQAIQDALGKPGVKVILARQECVIPSRRRGSRAGDVQVVDENCNLCKLCVMLTGCMAISLGNEAIEIDPEQCYGCGLCIDACNRDAIEWVEGESEAERL